MDAVTIKREKKSISSFLSSFMFQKASDIGSNTDSGSTIKRAVSALFNICTCIVKGRILFPRGFFFLFWRKTKTSIDR